MDDSPAERRPPLERRESLPEVGACYNCGFLCLEDQEQLTQLELPSGRRSSGQWFRLHDGWRIHCYRDIELYNEIASYLGSEPLAFSIPDTDKQGEQNRACNAVFTKDRQCDKWFLHKPGRSPEQHYKAYEMYELEKLRQASAETQKVIMDELKEITAEHATTAKIQADILRRMERDEKIAGKQTTRFN